MVFQSDDNLSVEITEALARLPECLADARARLSLHRIARLLPRALISGPLGLEVRLAGPTAVDFFAAAIPGEPSFAALISTLRNPAYRSCWSDPQGAIDLAIVLERWQRGEGALASVARYLLLEMDAPMDPDGPLALPSIFLAPKGVRDVRAHAGPLPNAFHRQIEATTMATAELSSVWPHPTTADALAKVVASLPSEGEIFAVGAMISRAAGSAMRIAIRRLDAGGIQAVLAAIGRSRQADLLADCISATPAEQHDLHFEIGPGAESRVGLELSPAHNWKQASAQGWAELLDDLVERALADADRVAVVTPLIDGAGDPRWGLAHVKVAADENGILPMAKLYVGIQYPDSRIA